MWHAYKVVVFFFLILWLLVTTITTAHVKAVRYSNREPNYIQLSSSVILHFFFNEQQLWEIKNKGNNPQISALLPLSNGLKTFFN